MVTELMTNIDASDRERLKWKLHGCPIITLSIDYIAHVVVEGQVDKTEENER